jgi:hypothetical protein
VRCIGFSGITYIVAPSSRHPPRALGIATECPVGMPKLVPKTRAVVRLTGVSVSLNAVPGRSSRETTAARETNNSSKMIIVQRKCFTEKTPKPETTYALWSWLSR